MATLEENFEALNTIRLFLICGSRRRSRWGRLGLCSLFEGLGINGAPLQVDRRKQDIMCPRVSRAEEQSTRVLGKQGTYPEPRGRGRNSFGRLIFVHNVDCFPELCVAKVRIHCIIANGDKTTRAGNRSAHMRNGLVPLREGNGIA